jgi:hypothetical protein
MWHSQVNEEGKPRYDLIKFETNSDFVTIGDFNPGTHEVHGFDEPGYKVDKEGKHYFPMVFTRRNGDSLFLVPVAT